MEANVERRASQRFYVKDGAYVYLGSQSETLGQIIEISASGLSFLHLSGKEPLEGPSELVIILADRSFYFEKMPCSIVSDMDVCTELFMGSKTVRRGSVQFGELTNEQTSQLEHFIRNYAMGEAR